MFYISKKFYQFSISLLCLSFTPFSPALTVILPSVVSKPESIFQKSIGNPNLALIKVKRKVIAPKDWRKNIRVMGDYPDEFEFEVIKDIKGNYPFKKFYMHSVNLVDRERLAKYEFWYLAVDKNTNKEIGVKINRPASPWELAIKTSVFPIINDQVLTDLKLYHDIDHSIDYLKMPIHLFEKHIINHTIPVINVATDVQGDPIKTSSGKSVSWQDKINYFAEEYEQFWLDDQGNKIKLLSNNAGKSNEIHKKIYPNILLKYPNLPVYLIYETPSKKNALVVEADGMPIKTKEVSRYDRPGVLILKTDEGGKHLYMKNAQFEERIDHARLSKGGFLKFKSDLDNSNTAWDYKRDEDYLQPLYSSKGEPIFCYGEQIFINQDRKPVYHDNFVTSCDYKDHYLKENNQLSNYMVSRASANYTNIDHKPIKKFFLESDLVGVKIKQTLPVKKMQTIPEEKRLYQLYTENGDPLQYKNGRVYLNHEGRLLNAHGEPPFHEEDFYLNKNNLILDNKTQNPPLDKFFSKERQYTSKAFLIKLTDVQMPHLEIRKALVAVGGGYLYHRRGQLYVDDNRRIFRNHHYDLEPLVINDKSVYLNKENYIVDESGKNLNKEIFFLYHRETEEDRMAKKAEIYNEGLIVTNENKLVLYLGNPVNVNRLGEVKIRNLGFMISAAGNVTYKGGRFIDKNNNTLKVELTISE